MSVISSMDSNTKADEAVDLKSLVIKERNRIHARNTRKRRKEKLRQQQNYLAQLINEEKDLEEKLEDLTSKQNLQLRCVAESESSSWIEEQNIDESSQHEHKETKNSNSNRKDIGVYLEELPEIRKSDLLLLPPDIREQQRKERNRVHARRTRQRKKLVQEKIDYQIRRIRLNVRRLKEEINRMEGKKVSSCTGSQELSSTATVRNKEQNLPPLRDLLRSADFQESPHSTFYSAGPVEPSRRCYLVEPYFPQTYVMIPSQAYRYYDNSSSYHNDARSECFIVPATYEVPHVPKRFEQILVHHTYPVPNVYHGNY